MHILGRTRRKILFAGLILILGLCLIGGVHAAVHESVSGITGDRFVKETGMCFSNFSTVPVIPAAFESVEFERVQKWKNQFIDPVATRYYRSLLAHHS